MLCSISTSTAASDSKPTPNWLDRLHTSRGLTVPAHLHLDHFLSSNPNPSPNPNPNPNPPPPLPPLQEEDPDPSPPPQEPAANSRRRKKHLPPAVSDDKQQQQQQQQQHLFDLMGGVLAELFVMGGPPVVRELKTARKQPNPRVCVPSVSASIDAGCRAPQATSPPSSADNSVAEAKKSRTKLRRKRGTAGGPVELDLSAFSRTDVTVIDTSCPGWKSEKVIFRKGIMWKVRDKKVWNLSRKKRKLGLVGRLVNEKEKEQALAEPKIPAGEELLASLVEESAPLDKDNVSEKTCPQIPVSIRQKFSRSPRAHATKDSTSHLNAATSRKNGISGPKAPAKGR